MGRPRKPRVNDAIDFWIKSKLRYGSIGGTSVYFAEKFRRLMGDRPILDLKGSDISDYVNRGQGAPAQRREINTVKSIVNYWRKMHGHQPLYLDRPRDNAGRERWLTVEERDQFLAEAPEELKPIATALFFTGARKGELMKLETEAVDYARKTLRLRSLKGGRGEHWRVIPIHDRLWPFIEAAREGGGLVFPGPTGQKWREREFYGVWWPHVVRMGLKDFKPHDARHTFASELVRQGVSLRVVADLLGHKNLSMVMRYSHVSAKDGREAILTL